jgi:hypothetical protein
MPNPGELVRYDAMCRAIDAAYEVDEVKDIRDKARAIEVYSRQAKNTENERRACEIRLRAERKAGQLLAQMEKPKAAPGNQYTGPVERGDGSKTLRDLGISRDQSSRWQKLGAIPQPEFEAALADRPSTSGIIRANTEPKPEPVSHEALWLWGRLRDFEREGLLAQRPADVLRTMPPQMIEDVRSIAPRVAAWLQQLELE